MADREQIEVPTTHPMESILGIEEGTTMVPAIQHTTELVVSEQYDDKDAEIDSQFQEVYELSIGAFELQTQDTGVVEGKYKARGGEVAAQYLNIALSAARDKAALKVNKDKLILAAKKSTTPKVQNNLIVGDRNDIIRALMEQDRESDPIDITPRTLDETE